MSIAWKLLLVFLVVAVVSEEVTASKLLKEKMQWIGKVARAKISLIRPLMPGPVIKDIVAAKLIGAKALIGTKLAIGALAAKHVIGRVAASNTQTTSDGVLRSAAAASPTAFASSITLPEIHVPVRFTIGGAEPPFRTDSPQPAAEF